MTVIVGGSTPQITFADGTIQNTSANISAPYTANTVVYASSTSALATGSALTWNGTALANNNATASDSITNTFYLQTSGAGKAANFQIGSSGVLQTWVYGGSSWVNATTIDSSGNLGLGTSSPDTRLTVLKNSNADFSSQANLRASALQTFSNTQATTAVVFNGASGNPDKFISVDTQGGYQYFSLGYQNGSSRYNVIQFDQNNTIYFSTNATERARIDSSGNLLVGTTTANAKITSYASSGQAPLYAKVYANGDAGIFFANASNTVVGSVTVNSTGVLYNITSDQRLKTNIVDAPDGNIDQIKIRSFDWKSDGTHNTYGVIAQELVEVAPYAVHQPANPDEMMAVDYSKLVPMMIKEIQSLKAEVAKLKGV